MYGNKKIDEIQLTNAIDLIWSTFLQFEAPNYSEEGIQSFKDFIDNKEILIQEKTIGEIKKLVNELNMDFSKLMETEINKEGFLNDVFGILQDKIEVIFPQLKDIDMDNVYISELEALIDGFLEVNFLMLKKVFMKVTTMM